MQPPIDIPVALTTLALFILLLFVIFQLSIRMERLGSAKITFTHSPHSISLKTRDGATTSLARICQDSTPPCRLNPLLFNGHLQTMWTAIKDDGPPLHYKRKIFESEDCPFPGTFAVDFVVQEPESEKDESLPPRMTYFSKEALENIGSLDNRPMLVALHGVSGGSSEAYLKHVLAPLAEGEGDRRWETCVVNSRGCAMHKVTSEFTFNARSTWDLRQTVLWLKKTFPNRPLFGVGFSLGANVLINVSASKLLLSSVLRNKYLGEEGDACILKAAVVVSNPWILDVCNTMLKTTMLGRFYLEVMGQNVKKMFYFNYEELSKNPRLDLEACEKMKYLYDFDIAVQAPTWGYASEQAYYRDASSVDTLLGVKIPVFAINAENDPVSLLASG